MTKQEAINVMEKYTDETLSKVVQEAHKMAIVALRRNTEWIPVSERPPEDGIYLCTMDGELCGIDQSFTGMCGIENGVWDEPDCVIAWMPLPEPYIPDSKPDLQEPAADHYMNRFTEVR